MVLEGAHVVPEPFQVYGTRSGLAFVGEVDRFSGPTFSSVLAGAGVATPDAVVLDFSQLEFADVDAMCRLAGFARTMRDQGRDVIVLDALPIVRRLWTLIGPTMKADLRFE
jgi:anti-anti-sigma regulatory factor